MSGRLISVAIAAALAAGSSGATVLDFAGFANGTSHAGEQGFGTGTTAITSSYFGGMKLNFLATKNGNAAYAYFDKGPSPSRAGLGVCGQLDSNNQCTPPNDDNLQAGEIVTVSFTGPVTLSNLLFNADGHTPIGSNFTNTLSFGFNGAGPTVYTFGALEGMTFHNVTSMTFAYGDAKGQQYYIDSAVVSAVPVPASAFLLLGGIGAFASLRRKKRKIA